MRYIFILLFLSLGLSAVAQQNIVESLQRNRAGEGTVTIRQDPKITGLIGSIYTGNVTGGEQKMLKARGYRVQVYAGNNSRVARNEANNVAAKVKEEFPDMPVYAYFQPPRWLCRVGDFRSIEEADAAMRRLKVPVFLKKYLLFVNKLIFPWTNNMEELLHPEWSAEKIEQLKGHYQSILSLLGEDVEREGLLKTPERVAKAMLTLTRGYEQDPHAILLGAKFKEEYSQMVIVKDIDFFSLCEHHMLPFYGKAHVAYIPNGYITGLSKIARVVDVFSHRLQVQERMTLQIKECIQETLNPLGVMVVVEAKHMCMQMRGVEKQNAITTTSDFTGAFNQAKTREEFMNLIRHNR